MAKSCLHCMIHDAIRAHALEARSVAEDGTALVVAPEALAALAAVVADIVASGDDDGAQASAFSFLMQRLAKSLNARGVETTVTTVDDSAADAPAQVLH